MKTFRSPDTINSPMGYSHQVEVDSSERWLVMAGQIGKAADGSVPEDPIEQIVIALNNIKGNLAAAHMEITDLVKMTWYMVGEVDSGRRRELVAAWLGGHKPCTTHLYVAALAAPIYKVEIDAWACAEPHDRPVSRSRTPSLIKR